MVTLPNIGLFDICLGISYLIIIYFLVHRFQRKVITKNPEYRYLLPALSAKILGAIVFVLISIFYYKSGDTFLYFEIGEELRNHLFNNPSETLTLLITPYSELKTLDYHPLQVYNYQLERSTTWFFSRIVFFFNLISFGSYLVSSLLMATISFLGLWLGYSALSQKYSKVSKWMLIPFFFIPTASIWSSGILKDTLLMGIIGFLLSIGINLFIKRKQILINTIWFFLCILLIIFLKPILAFTLTPCFLFWGVLHFTKPISSIYKRSALRFGIIALTLAGLFIISYNLPITSKYKYQNLPITLSGFQKDHSFYRTEGSIYTLGKMEYTPIGIVKKAPEAINVTFFRPYIWETTNLPTLLASVEALLLLFFSIFTLIVTKKYFLKRLISNYDIMFLISFALLFAIINGLSAYNFGALSRFKIPAVLFFSLGFTIMLHKRQHLQQEN